MKKLLSWLLVLALCMSLFPATALAEGETEDPAPVEEPAGDGVPDVPSEEETPPSPTQAPETAPLPGEDIADPDALPEEPIADEPQTSGTCGDNLTWTLENGLLTISGTGDMSNWEWQGAPWYDYKDDISSVTMPVGMTSIGNCAFQDCGSLTEMTIPEGVTSIGESAFDGCSALIAVTIPTGVTSLGEYAFNGCTALTNVTIPVGVTSIGKCAFQWCGSLTSVTIPAGVTSLGNFAFNYCTALASVTIPEGVTSIGAATFQCCSSLTEVTIPEGVTSLGDFAFNYCTALTSVTIPGSVVSIGTEAFSCIALSDIQFGGTCAAWKQLAVDYDYYSVTVHCIDGTIAAIDRMYCGDDLTWTLDDNGVLIVAGTGDMWNFVSDKSPWYESRNEITSVRLQSGVTSIGNYAFQDCSGLRSMSIPGNVTSIGQKAFFNCYHLTSVTIPGSVTSIGEEAFFNCSELTSVTISEGVTSIGEFAFENCTMLGSVELPGSVASVGDFAFSYCGRLTEVRFAGAAPSFGYEVFSGVTATVYYPAGDETWTKNVMQDYGGTITWVSYEPEPAMVFVHASVPESWQNPCAWAWTDGGCVFDAWPGEPMAPDGDWYTIQIPAWASYFIVNANNGRVQTEDLPIEPGREVWITVREDGSAKVSYVLPKPVASGECGDNLTWTLDADGVLTISGTGDMWDWNNDGDMPWYDSLGEIVSLTLKNGVTGIGNNAFAAAHALSQVYFPDGLLRIGTFAFEECAELTEVFLPATLTAIEDGAFEMCSGLTEVRFAGSAPSFGNEVFGGVTATAYYPAGDETWTEDVLQNYGGTITWVSYEPEPETVFVHASVPESWQNPCAWAWTGGSCVFDAWPGEPMEPDGDWYTIQIPAWASYFIVNANEGSVQTEDLPIEPGREVWITVHEDGSAEVSYEKPGPVAFGECGDDLTWTLDEDGILTISGTGNMWDFEFGGAPWADETDNIYAVRMMPGVTSIGEHAFCYCFNMTRAAIPESVTDIGSWAFFSCGYLTGVTIPAGVTGIGMQGFAYCSRLTSLTIPESMTSIDDSAFMCCIGLKEVYFRGHAPAFGYGVFEGDEDTDSVTATAYYPARDESWTEDVMQDYGGTITWVSYEPGPLGIPVDEEHFPDPIFRAYVSEHFDLDWGGYLSDAEIAAAKSIDLGYSGVASLEGVQYLTGLIVLTAEGDFSTAGALTQVDLSANTKLKGLYLGFNPLEGLDVSMLPELMYLMVGYCGLSELDLSGNPKLKELWCDDNNLSELDLSNNPDLTHLDCCGNTGLLELDITPCPSLVADYQAGGRHISWMQEAMPEQYEIIMVYGGTNDDDYNLAVNTYTTIIAPEPPTHTPGDINGDGKVTVADVTLLAKYVKARGQGVTIVEGSGNVDGSADGKITVSDVTLLAKYVKARGHGVVIY